MTLKSLQEKMKNFQYGNVRNKIFIFLPFLGVRCHHDWVSQWKKPFQSRAYYSNKYFRYILLGASLFKAWENWDYLDGSYFCFISLSSIGFGDLVPGATVSLIFLKRFGFMMHFNFSLNNSFAIKSSLNKNCAIINCCTIIWCGFSYMNNTIFMVSLWWLCDDVYEYSNCLNCNGFELLLAACALAEWIVNISSILYFLEE